MKVSLLLVLLGFVMSSAIHAQVSTENSRIVVDDVDLQGAVHLPASVKRQLVSNLIHSEYSANSNWIADIEDKVGRAEIEGWPDRENQGYLGFSVQAQWKAILREPGLLHVRVTINLDEGRQKRLKEITFRYVGTHSVPPTIESVDLRKLVPLSDGEVYNRDRFWAGMEAVDRAYFELGFVDMTWNSESQADQENQTVAIVVDLNEGQRYTWGSIQVIGLEPRLETLLKSRLKPGSPANPKPIEDFYRDNQSLLPIGVSPKDVKWKRDAERATVDLTFDFRTPVSP